MTNLSITHIPEIEIKDLKSKFSDFEALCETLKNEPLISYDIFKENGKDLTNVGSATMLQILENNNIEIYNYDLAETEIITKDFAGFYMFYKGDEPIYCGISRNVLKRIADHTKGGKQSATFAHRLLMSEPLETKEKTAKLKDYKEEVLSFHFKLIKFYTPCEKTDKCYTRSIEHEEEVLMYLFEVFASVYFNTAHNSFRTH